MVTVRYAHNRPTRTIQISPHVGKPGKPGRQAGRSIIFRSGAVEHLEDEIAATVQLEVTRQGIAVDFTFGVSAAHPSPGTPAMRGAPPRQAPPELRPGKRER